MLVWANAVRRHRPRREPAPVQGPLATDRPGFIAHRPSPTTSRTPTPGVHECGLRSEGGPWSAESPQAAQKGPEASRANESGLSTSAGSERDR